MEKALLIDIGSTYTKVALIDLSNLLIITKEQARTTVDKNVNIGLKKALKKVKDWKSAKYKLACSSAAGGLKIVAIGLVPELTAEAAKRAALGAGSKVLKTYCYELTTKDMEEIFSLNPDIILLAGGTDGGNKEIITKNAQLIAGSNLECPVIIAGNRSAADEVKYIFNKVQKTSYITENVMPGLEELNIEPARNKIREIFLDNIAEAKGLSSVKGIIDGVIMPTPAAVLEAASLLARGYKDIQGLGELLIVDIGGATTDIHSIATGEPVSKDINWQGLQEPFIKRTVEGDIGMRYNVLPLVKMIGIENIREEVYKLTAKKIKEDKLRSYIIRLHNKVEYLPKTYVEKVIDRILARNAVEIATARHVGSIKTVYTPLGTSSIQEGKDLTELKTVIGTGGIIVNNEDFKFIMSGVLYKNQNNPQLLAPVNPNFMVDKKYIMAFAGILADIDRAKSLKLLKKYIN